MRRQHARTRCRQHTNGADSTQTAQTAHIQSINCAESTHKQRRQHTHADHKLRRQYTQTAQTLHTVHKLRGQHTHTQSENCTDSTHTHKGGPPVRHSLIQNYVLLVQFLILPLPRRRLCSPPAVSTAKLASHFFQKGCQESPAELETCSISSQRNLHMLA